VGGQTILFLHGFASSAQSTKARYLGEKLGALPQVAYYAIDFNPTPADFETITTTGQINRLRQFVLDRDLGEFRIIGSSYGGLIALHYGHRFGGVGKMLLLAPGLRWLNGGLSDEELEHWRKRGALPVPHPAFGREVPVRYDLQVDGLRYLRFIPPPAPALIVHGRNDSTVPLDHSRWYAAEYPERVQLVEVEADHDLNGHLDLIWESVKAFLLRAEQGGE
jgi:pimeloyl-ACP methyl ester carboxylesterase